jgi:hypothetical protein
MRERPDNVLTRRQAIDFDFGNVDVRAHVDLEGALGHFQAAVVEVDGVGAGIGGDVVDGVGAVLVVGQGNRQVVALGGLHVDLEFAGSGLAAVHVEVRRGVGLDVVVESGPEGLDQGWIQRGLHLHSVRGLFGRHAAVVHLQYVITRLHADKA